jgi:hypothetical protein
MVVIHDRDRPIIHSASGEPSLSMVVNREVGATSLSVWTTRHMPGEIVPLHGYRNTGADTLRLVITLADADARLGERADAGSEAARA